LVVDDGSTDETRSIVSQYPVTLLSTGTNSGHATARNVGIAAARGDLIAWIDADDVWERTHLDVVGGLLDRFPKASVGYSAIRFFGNRSGMWHGAAEVEVAPRNHFWDCLKSTCVHAMSAITRTAAIRRVGGFDSSIRTAPDFATWLRMSFADPFVGTRQVTAHYRWHDHQISNSPGIGYLSFAQQRSIYASRYAIMDEIRRLGKVDCSFVGAINSHVQSVYRNDLRKAIKLGDKAAFRHLLALSVFVPDGPIIAMQFRVKWFTPDWLLRPLSRARRLMVRTSGKAAIFRPG
jgi:glycosyltransferase involved in cell wall biosynthesis